VEVERVWIPLPLSMKLNEHQASRAMRLCETRKANGEKIIFERKKLCCTWWPWKGSFSRSLPLRRESVRPHRGRACKLRR